MVKVYYGNSWKEALSNDPLYTNNASQISSMERAYAYVEVEDITYEDIQDEMSDEDRIKLYEEETGETLDKVDDRFWDWAEETYC